MYIFNFQPNAGEKAATPATPNTPDYSAIANKVFVQILEKHELEVENPHVSLDGTALTVTGTAKDQTTREKIVLALGNIQGISQVVDKMETAAPAEEPSQFHTVVKGESLSKIAKQYYGDAMKYPVIFDANKPMLKDPNLIYPGQVLRIPAL